VRERFSYHEQGRLMGVGTGDAEVSWCLKDQGAAVAMADDIQVLVLLRLYIDVGRRMGASGGELARDRLRRLLGCIEAGELVIFRSDVAAAMEAASRGGLGRSITVEAKELVGEDVRDVVTVMNAGCYGR